MRPLLCWRSESVVADPLQGLRCVLRIAEPALHPGKVLGQLGNRVQHALRAFTPRDQKAVKSVAETMRANPKIDTTKAILELAVGEALVSFLDAKGTPGITERAWVLAPGSQIGPISPEQRKQIINSSIVPGFYEKTMDRLALLDPRGAGRGPVRRQPAAGRRARRRPQISQAPAAA